LNILLNPIKTLYFILESFFNDDTTYYAASLSFFTIFSLLPILALLVVGISYMDSFTQYLDVFTLYILEMINPVHSDSFIDFIKRFLSNSNELGSIGIFYMIFVFTMFFKDYENIISRIHRTKSRALHKSFILYLLFLFILPILFVLFILIQSLYQHSIYDKITTFIFAWGLFFILFKISINRMVSFKPLFYSSFLTVATLSITKNLFIYYVIYNKTYETIYGSFSTIMFFFLWIYISWIIYLYGIKICYKFHNIFPKKDI